MFRKTKHHIHYSIALLLSNKKRKTFESLGDDVGLSGDTMARLVTKNIITMKELISAARSIFKKKKVYLLIDDTLIKKTYSRVIEGTCDNYDSSDRRPYRSLCTVVAMLTDGNIAIPIDQEIWTSKEFKKGEYRKKWELAQILIKKIRQYVVLSAVIMDGLYAITDFMRWLCRYEINFEARFHSNRVIERNNIKSQIKKITFLALKGGRTKKTIQASWKGMSLYFTAFKRQLASGNFTKIFQVSNMKTSSSEHIKIYGYRWNIEKFFRTAKQGLGLNDCQSRKLIRQKGHILNVFVAYVIAQYERIRKKLKNVETAIKSIKTRFLTKPDYAINRFREIFQHV